MEWVSLYSNRFISSQDFMGKRIIWHSEFTRLNISFLLGVALGQNRKEGLRHAPVVISQVFSSLLSPSLHTPAKFKRDTTQQSIKWFSRFSRGKYPRKSENPWTRMLVFIRISDHQNFSNESKTWFPTALPDGIASTKTWISLSVFLLIMKRLFSPQTQDPDKLTYNCICEWSRLPVGVKPRDMWTTQES